MAAAVPGNLYKGPTSSSIKDEVIAALIPGSGREDQTPEHEASLEARVSEPRNGEGVRPLPRLCGRCGG